MKRVALTIVALVCALGLIAAPGVAKKKVSHQAVAAEMAQAYVKAKPLPVPSLKTDIKKLVDAYKLQTLFVKKLGASYGKRIGYKAGLTSKGARKKFKVRSSVTGVLLQKMLLKPGALVNRKGHTRLFIEVELGYVIGKAITKPVKYIKNLRKYVAGVMAAIELPDINIGNLKKMTGRDIIAINVGARAYILGPVKPVGKLKLNTITVTLSYNGKVVKKSVGKAALGGQMKALRWAVNNILKYGGKIDKGDVIITGSLTGLFPGKPGKYVATFGPLGKIAFAIK